VSDLPPARSVEELLELYRRWGDDPYDEQLRQSEHALQTASLARASGADPNLTAAALLHDVGHLLHLAAGGAAPDAADHPDLDHEYKGARYLAGLFGPAVTAPIALHVRAKRYLWATDPDYAAGLSAGSRASLERQGGQMAPEECRSFEANPAWESAVRLRRWDDGGKVEGLYVGRIEDYGPMLSSVSLEQRR
jgi:[1-hydroxy-2-(trimethylamino)ethyl]phosphonate dioxygenase